MIHDVVYMIVNVTCYYQQLTHHHHHHCDHDHHLYWHWHFFHLYLCHHENNLPSQYQTQRDLDLYDEDHSNLMEDKKTFIMKSYYLFHAIINFSIIYLILQHMKWNDNHIKSYQNGHMIIKFQISYN